MEESINICKGWLDFFSPPYSDVSDGAILGVNHMDVFVLSCFSPLRWGVVVAANVIK